VAVSDASRIIASPLEVIDRRRTDVTTRLRKICEEYEIGAIVVGLPMSLSGDEGPAALAARELGAAVATSTGHDVVYWDERFTTRTAEAALIESGMRRKDRRDHRDKVAAAVMLQGFLDHHRLTHHGDTTNH
jgi:putative Holliday junction resolvase